MKTEMNRICSTHEGNEKHTKRFGQDVSRVDTSCETYKYMGKPY